MHSLAEDLLLLALDDDEGTASWRRSDAHPYGLGGALLMDLALLERIDTAGKEIFVSDPSPTGDAVLDAALETIRASDKPREAKHWVKKLGERRGLNDQLARRLVARGILREQEHTFLWVFHDVRFPTRDPRSESALREQLRDVVLAGVGPDTRTLLPLSLVRACDLTAALFAREERKHARRRIEELVEDEQFGRAVGGAVADAAASVAATVAATTVVTASSSG
jgi:hypothetical protein